MGQLQEQLGAVDVHLSDEVLDQIDTMVAPGQTVGDDKNACATEAMTNPFLRRRRT